MYVCMYIYIKTHTQIQEKIDTSKQNQKIYVLKNNNIHPFMKNLYTHIQEYIYIYIHTQSGKIYMQAHTSEQYIHVYSVKIYIYTYTFRNKNMT